MIIQSLLDNDLYKFSMMQAVLEQYPNTNVKYCFKNRGSQHLGDRVRTRLQQELELLSNVSLFDFEAQFLESISFFKPGFISYLSQYNFNPDQVRVFSDFNGSLGLEIEGPWRDTILWEVPLMALISEIYFEENGDDLSGAQKDAQAKARKLDNNCHFADFGTRRRRSVSVHDEIIKGLKQANTFVGTSNVKLAMQHGLKPIGTMAHEWIMAISVLESLRHANRYALRKWKEVYKADLGIALTDTFGTKAFWDDFDLELAKVYDGVRHDSGDPLTFGAAAIQHYENLGIDPTSKRIVFSDGLSPKKALKIQSAFEGQIGTAFGIGTNFTNDFSTPALNMVIKLRSVDGIPVVKLSDEPGKATGAEAAVDVAKWTFGGV